MSQTLSRQELSRIFSHKNTVYLSSIALFCLTIASFAFHLSFGRKFLSQEMLLPWGLLHVFACISLWNQKLHRIFSLLMLGAFQFYCVSILKQDASYIPLAPAFFVVCTVLASFQVYWPKIATVFLWLALWMSVFFWSGPSTAADSNEWFARTSVVFGSLVFLICFFLISHTTQALTKKIIKEFGPKESFDEPRIQSARLHVIGEISASLVHEIANPITNIGGYNYQITEELKDAKIVNKTIQNASERIAFNVERTRDIIVALKGFARHQDKNKEELFDFKQMLSDSVSLVHHHIKKNGVQFERHIPENSILLQGSRIELGQVVINFLINALNVVSATDGKKEIELNFTESKKWVEVIVRDSGGGVPPDIVDKIFDPFYTTKSKSGGTGLGLYISKIIAERNGSEIRYKPVRDLTSKIVGASFSLKIQKHRAAKVQNKVA